LCSQQLQHCPSPIAPANPSDNIPKPMPASANPSSPFTDKVQPPIAVPNAMVT
jgi:hypothetical protein